ncbi:hypothetical protein [Teichococcus aestuarii]|uniref:Uncharacterized protein n=1 Tax=Teichococcus aestuarii TaxID=568898 RepID=A0A2U1V6P5_9PROT|nr:hypothetical protein [Pseudoroseomonas aestuarii]PWC29551.1 hypothetical protein CR165_06290 [Pseudoroseomonas aestuarii]
MGRKRSKSIPNTRAPRLAGPSSAPPQGAAAQGEVERLRQELEEARALLREISQGPEGERSRVARRLATLEEERQIARGHAVEAALARSRAEAELKALRDAIHKAPGLQGWLLRRASRHLLKG